MITLLLIAEILKSSNFGIRETKWTICLRLRAWYIYLQGRTLAQLYTCKSPRTKTLETMLRKCNFLYNFPVNNHNNKYKPVLAAWICT